MTKTERKILNKMAEFQQNNLKKINNQKDRIYPIGLCSLFYYTRHFLKSGNSLEIEKILEFCALAPKECWDNIHDNGLLYPFNSKYWWTKGKDKDHNFPVIAVEERLTALAFMLTMPEDMVPELKKIPSKKKSKTKKKKK